MVQPDFDITLLGDKQLERMLAQLPQRSQRTVVRAALKKSIKRIHQRLIQHLSGFPVAPHTGRLLMAIAGSKVQFEKKRNQLRFGVPLPSRADLGISPTDKFYYPRIVEYGAPHIPARAPMRKAIDNYADFEIADIKDNIGKGIERTAKRLGMVVK